MSYGSLPQGQKGRTLSPLRLETAGMTLSEQTKNTTSNTPHEVRRSDSLFPPPPRFLGSFAFIFAFCVLVPVSLLPPLALGGGPFAPVGIYLMAPPRPACPLLRGPFFVLFRLPSSVPCVVLRPLWGFALLGSWFSCLLLLSVRLLVFAVSVVLLFGFGRAPLFLAW